MNERTKPRRGRPQTLDAENTLDVAMQAYWQADPADVSLNTICGLAGVSKPALYRQFGNEDGLMHAVLDRYAEKVLSDIFEILSRNASLTETLEALVDFCARDPKMETGCVFYKMRAGKHRLGPKTLERVEEINAGSIEAFTNYLESRRKVGDWKSDQPASMIAHYLVEQIGLTFMQRAAGEDQTQINQTLKLAFSVVQGN